jgi:hypothetical protein
MATALHFLHNVLLLNDKEISIEKHISSTRGAQVIEAN